MDIVAVSKFIDKLEQMSGSSGGSSTVEEPPKNGNVILNQVQLEPVRQDDCHQWCYRNDDVPQVGDYVKAETNGHTLAGYIVHERTSSNDAIYILSVPGAMIAFSNSTQRTIILPDKFDVNNYFGTFTLIRPIDTSGTETVLFDGDVTMQLGQIGTLDITNATELAEGDVIEITFNGSTSTSQIIGVTTADDLVTYNIGSSSFTISAVPSNLTNIKVTAESTVGSTIHVKIMRYG